jgi:hypothetical protein
MARAVTIKSVSVTQIFRSYPLTLAAPVRYSTPGMNGSDQILPPASRVLYDVTHGPGKEMFIGFLVRSSLCAQKGTWISMPSFNVTEQFGFFTQTIAVPWGQDGDQLIMHGPSPHPSNPDTFCLGS